jgi:hypothetical protein
MADENTAIPDGYNIAWPTGYLIVRVSPEDESEFHERIEAWRAAEARLAVVERERDEARAALERIVNASAQYLYWSEQYIPPSAYDFDGMLAEAHAELSSGALVRARAALPTPEATK